MNKKIVIIGAGAAGLMAAAFINAPTAVLERGEKAGKKLYITGKGRCNLTNDCDTPEFLKNVLRGSRFVQSALFRFSPRFVMELFNQNGLSLKTERGRRVFPISDKASDVSKALIQAAQKNGATFNYNPCVKSIKPHENGYQIICESGVIFADIVIVATGGKSYAPTGSDGSMFGVLSALGHTVTPLCPSLVPFVLKEDVSALSGLSFKSVTASVHFSDIKKDENSKQSKAEQNEKEQLKTETGELLFTHSGISGPVILTLSAHTAGKKLNKIVLDLRPSDTADETDKKLVRLFSQDPNKEIKNILPTLLPKSLSWYIINSIKLDAQKKSNAITKAERQLLIDSIKKLTFEIEAAAGFNEAVVTSGGVDVREIDPKTMQSRLCPNLFIVGEALDIDALTGGYNLQLAWSTALAAADCVNQMICDYINN